ARVREVEHHRRVIGDQNIGEQEQLHDLRVEGHVMDETLPHDRHTVDHTWVATHEQYVVVAELVVHAPQVQVQIELVLTTRVVLVVAPCGCVKHYLLVLGQTQATAGAFGHRVLVRGEEDVVARVAGLQDVPAEAEGAAQEGCGERAGGDEGVAAEGDPRSSDAVVR